MSEPPTTRILVTGESGTGEGNGSSRAVHSAEPACGPAFVTAVNCAAIPRDLVESEMFGHERGAFTGRDQSDSASFEQPSLWDARCSGGQLVCRRRLSALTLETGDIRRSLESAPREHAGSDGPDHRATRNRQLDEAVESGRARSVFVASPDACRCRFETGSAICRLRSSIDVAGRIRPRQPPVFHQVRLADNGGLCLAGQRTGAG